MIKRILYSQNESVLKDDYFVINGVLEHDNVSNLSLDAFQIIKETENWKEIYKQDDIVIRQKRSFLNIKSHYINKDESDRYIFYIFYVEAKSIKEALELLKHDSQLIHKELGFEDEDLIQKIKSIKKKIKNKFLSILLIIIALSFLIWRTIK